MSGKIEVMKKLVSKPIERVSQLPSSLDSVQFSSMNIPENTFLNQKNNKCSLLDIPKSASSSIGTLHQKFTMEWEKNGDSFEINFTGLTGSLKDQAGKPGVVYSPTEKVVRVNLLMSRPDGSFVIATPDTLCMVVAPPNEDGNPDHEKTFYSSFTNGVKLPCGWWHSVPFPPFGATKIELDEIVADSNENNVINLLEETDSSLTVAL